MFIRDKVPPRLITFLKKYCPISISEIWQFLYDNEWVDYEEYRIGCKEEDWITQALIHCDEIQDFINSEMMTQHLNKYIKRTQTNNSIFIIGQRHCTGYEYNG